MSRSAVPLAHGLSYVDLAFQGRANAIATVLVSGGGQLALIDPGPTTCLEQLELALNASGFALEEVTDLLLTHIHLDHAGSAGALLRRQPRIRVHVHERGAPHLVDPSTLLSSATRLFGDDMERLWGGMLPVPAANIRTLQGDESIDAGGRRFAVAYTPGHASHHVSFFDHESGVAFVGDTAGVCIRGGWVLPPTPPPDVELDLWRDSLARIEHWSPQSLFITHFGPLNDVRPHIQMLLHNLTLVAGWARDTLRMPGTDEERNERFLEELDREMRRHTIDAQLASYRAAAPPYVHWLGLARYWRKRGEPAAGTQRPGAAS